MNAERQSFARVIAELISPAVAEAIETERKRATLQKINDNLDAIEDKFLEMIAALNQENGEAAQ